MGPNVFSLLKFLGSHYVLKFLPTGATGCTPTTCLLSWEQVEFSYLRLSSNVEYVVKQITISVFTFKQFTFEYLWILNTYIKNNVFASFIWQQNMPNIAALTSVFLMQYVGLMPDGLWERLHFKTTLKVDHRMKVIPALVIQWNIFIN